MTRTKVTACTIEYERTPRGDEIPRRGQCGGKGNLPRCELCPASPNYWRNTPEPTVVKFEIPDLDTSGWTEDKTPLITQEKGPALIGGVYGAVWIATRKCVICHIYTTWISPKGTRCHPSCAKNYLRDKARSKAEEAARRTTEPASQTDPA
jgi:hypothetical protein